MKDSADFRATREGPQSFDDHVVNLKAASMWGGARDKSVSSGVGSMQRPPSAMAQLFPDPQRSSKSEALTAKVRPMLAKAQSSPQGGYYPLSNMNNIYHPPQQQPSAKPANLFAYKPPPSPPPQSSVIKLPNGNFKYVTAGEDKPPPYPSPHDVMQGYRTSAPSSHVTQERSISVDIEALRRKFAHAPRPLKKRSSITEAERPQGPNIPKLLYDQIYKKADTPFYRPQLKGSHRSTPPPTYEESNKIDAIQEHPPRSAVDPVPGMSAGRGTSPGRSGDRLTSHPPAFSPSAPADVESSVTDEDREAGDNTALPPDDSTPTYLEKARYATTLTAKSILK